MLKNKNYSLGLL